MLDEAALLRLIGGVRAMRAQQKHLVEMAQQPKVTIQIMPLTSGGHAAAGGSFSVLHFTDDDLPDMVYLEQLSSAQYLDKPDVVSTYREVVDRLRVEAATQADSLTTLQTRLRET